MAWRMIQGWPSERLLKTVRRFFGGGNWRSIKFLHGVIENLQKWERRQYPLGGTRRYYYHSLKTVTTSSGGITGNGSENEQLQGAHDASQSILWGVPLGDAKFHGHSLATSTGNGSVNNFK